MNSYAFVLLFLVSLILGCGDDQDCLNIACASNVYPVFEDLSEKYNTEEDCFRISTASSSILFNQINNDAPYDVFYSADTMYPYQLFKNGKTVGKPFTYALGSLVLVSKKDNLNIMEFNEVSAHSFLKIAIPNPKFAPYGMAASEIAERYLTREANQNKVVYAQNVSQTNQLMRSGAVDLIVTSLSSKIFFNSDIYVFVEVPTEYHQPIIQNAVVLKKKKHIDKFIEFMNTHSAVIFKQYGYTISK